ncbi:MAG: transporter substrate-binding protein [Mucilaginibacter sp.]|nr:transporter substrate-binding protein [Mucilaginibacter sp.]
MQQTFTDQLSRKIVLADSPLRIISLVPSQTELLFDLGLDHCIIGVTKFCIHPAVLVKDKIKVGGTKKLRIDLIRSLKPDLIIGNKEENERSQIEALMEEFPVWMSDIANLQEALDMIKGIGKLTKTQDRARAITLEIEQQFKSLLPITKPLRVIYLIWQEPYIAAGQGTFINDMLQWCGFINTIEQERYPNVSADDLQRANPDVILLSSEPYPFKQKHIAEFTAMIPKARVILVDGEMFSWYGSRMLLAARYFENLIAKLNE